MKKQEKSFPRNYFGSVDPKNLPTSKDLDHDLAAFKRGTLVPFIKGLPRNARILDAGCGSGKAAKTVLAYRPDVEIYGVDISDVQEFLPEKVIFRKAGVEDVGEIFEKDFFDAIICQHVIEHLVYPIAMMESFKYVLKDGGKLFLETPNWSRAILPFSETFFWNDYTHIRIFTHFTMERLLKDFGFAVQSIVTVSSSGMIVRDDSIKKISNIYKKEGRNYWKLLKKMFRVGIVRIISPFLRDILISVSVNKK